MAKRNMNLQGCIKGLSFKPWLETRNQEVDFEYKT